MRIGAVSRGGLTRGDNQACDHDLGLPEQYIPWGIVEEDRGQLHIAFGSSYKTSDFIVDTLEAWWAALDEAEHVAMARLQINMDNGPESSEAPAIFASYGGVLRRHWQADAAAVLPTVP